MDYGMKQVLNAFGLRVEKVPNFKGMGLMIQNWLDWIDDGAPAHPQFDRSRDLIATCIYWDAHVNDGQPIGEQRIRDYFVERFTKFWPVQANPENPFDADHEAERRDGTAWSNPKQLEWVRNYLFPSCWPFMRQQYEARLFLRKLDI